MNIEDQNLPTERKRKVEERKMKGRKEEGRKRKGRAKKKESKAKEIGNKKEREKKRKGKEEESKRNQRGITEERKRNERDKKNDATLVILERKGGSIFGLGLLSEQMGIAEISFGVSPISPLACNVCNFVKNNFRCGHHAQLWAPLFSSVITSQKCSCANIHIEYTCLHHFTSMELSISIRICICICTCI